MTLPKKPRYRLLDDNEMDDRESAATERMFEAKRQRRAQQAPQDTPNPENES